MNSAGATDVVKSVSEARPPGFVECSGTAESESRLAGSPVVGVGLQWNSWSRATGTTSAFPSAKDVDGVSWFVTCSAMTESVLAVSSDEDSSDETGPPCSKVCCWCSASWDCEVRSLRRRHRRITCRSLRRWHRRITCWSLRRWRRRIRECRSPWSSVGGMTGTAEVTAGAKSVAAARPPGGAKDMAMTAATAVVP